MKKYAPDQPSSEFHRAGDLNYPRELLQVAGLSQREAAGVLGIDERALRYKLAGGRGKDPAGLAYSEQFILELLADRAQTFGAHEVREVSVPYDVAASKQSSTIWHQSTDRPITKADEGKMIVAYDKHNAAILGTVVVDEFGPIIQEADGIDFHRVPAAKVVEYALIDPPPRSIPKPEKTTG